MFVILKNSNISFFVNTSLLDIKVHLNTLILVSANDDVIARVNYPDEDKALAKAELLATTINNLLLEKPKELFTIKI